MGNLIEKQREPIVSNSENGYNPFNIPSIQLNDPSEFNASVAMRGCPPLHGYTKAEFANLSTEEKAAYADGVVRGSYEKDWLRRQYDSFDAHMNTNESAIGALAYFYLKTGDEKILKTLTEWNQINKDNNDRFN